MRAIILCAFFFISSCDSSHKSTAEKLFDELSLGLVVAWSESVSNNHIPTFLQTAGDTIIFYDEILLIKARPDTLIPNFDCPECYINLPDETALIITRVDEHIVNLKTIGDSTVHGFLFKDDFLSAKNPGIDYQRKELLNSFEGKREELKFRLMDKYELTENEFYRKVGAEYSRRTGNPGFSF